MTQLGNKLRELREQHGMNKRQLADHLGVTPPAISHMEKGIRKPSFEMLVKLSETFGVSSDELTRMSTVTEKELAAA